MTMERWEYRTLKYKAGGFLGGKIDTDEFEQALNEQGSEGWEVISCFDTTKSEGSTREVIVVFKRRRD
jgi:hypothetical protein